MADDATAGSPTTTNAAATKESGKTTAEIRDLADKIRGRVDTLGKALGAIGTTAVTAVGLAKIADLFPVEDEWWWFGLAIAGFVMGALAVLLMATRLMKVSNPIYMHTDLDAMEADDEISAKERRLIEPLFLRSARMNGAATLAAYELGQCVVQRAQLAAHLLAQLVDELGRVHRLAQRPGELETAGPDPQSRAAHADAHPGRRLRREG